VSFGATARAEREGSGGVDGRSSSLAAEVETLLAIALRGGKVWLKVLMRALMLSADCASSQFPTRGRKERGIVADAQARTESRKGTAVAEPAADACRSCRQCCAGKSMRHGQHLQPVQGLPFGTSGVNLDAHMLDQLDVVCRELRHGRPRCEHLLRSHRVEACCE
jgi:hypothetical protein